jgi:hypothetical protein
MLLRSLLALVARGVTVNMTHGKLALRLDCSRAAGLDPWQVRRAKILFDNSNRAAKHSIRLFLFALHAISI